MRDRACMARSPSTARPLPSGPLSFQRRRRVSRSATVALAAAAVAAAFVTLGRSHGYAASLATASGRTASPWLPELEASRRKLLIATISVAGAALAPPSVRAAPPSVRGRRTGAAERYVEKDPALPAFSFSRPRGWFMEDATLQQNTWRALGRTLKFTKGNLSLEVGVQPVNDGIQKLDQLGKPEDFARTFADSASKLYAPPNPANPSPVPNVTTVSMEADGNFTELLAQYRLQVGERPPLLFEMLVGLGNDPEKKGYLYSLTAIAPEAEFDSNVKLFTEVLQSFKFGAQK